jgi:renalase
MTENPVNADVLIVGAGMAGLMAANMLTASGLHVIVLDKGRSVGGRLATRRIGPGVADHGAQFFTARDPEFQKWVDQWLAEDLIFEWSRGFSDGSLQTQAVTGHPRYAVRGGMNALGKRLARDLKQHIDVNVRIVTATCDPHGWILQDEFGGLYTSKVLLMTPPVPQSLVILDEGATQLDAEDHDTLAAIEYLPCLAGMFWVEGLLRLPPPGAVQRRTGNILWIGDNQVKGISPDACIVTVQAGEQYSVQMWSAPDERILSAMRTSLSLYMDEGSVIREAQLKRWRYSRPMTVHPERCFVAKNDPLLVFAGDAFGGPRVEGAVLSGMAAAETILERVQQTE